MPRLNINTASAAALTDLPGIGPSLAQRIVDFRSQNGPFVRKRDLLGITGISERVLEPLIDRIALSPSGASSQSSDHVAGAPSLPEPETPLPTTPDRMDEHAAQASADDQSSAHKQSSDTKSDRKGRKKKKKKKAQRNRHAIRQLARQAGIKPTTLAAVIKTIALPGGFLKDGRPAAWFNGEAFWMELKQRGLNTKAIRKQYPTVVHMKNPGKYPLKGSKEYRRINRAVRIHPQAALRATYWGKYQMRGALYKKAGFNKVNAFVHAVHDSEDSHIAALLNVLQTRKITQALKRRDWPAFAQLYFGNSQQKQWARSLHKTYRQLRKSKKRR